MAFSLYALILVVSVLNAPLCAVPPGAPPADASKNNDAHPAAANRAPEKIAGASDEAALSMSGFRKPAGWQVSLFAAEPELANPVALFVDHTGRVYVCESFRQSNGVTDNRSHNKTWLRADLAANTVEDRIAYHRQLLGEKANEYTAHDDRIRLLADTNGDMVADTATVFADQFNKLEDGTGAGVLEINGDVFYTCIPKLWRLRDKDNDGVAEERDALYDGFGVRVAFRGHDMHGLVIGPDGRLYFSIGDRGYHVKVGDQTFANPESGAVFRCELDGSKLEIFATGLRNPQELAFDDWGNLFTGDNNSDSGDKARWVNVLEGGDTGWRMMYQYISDRGPFNREKIWQPYSSDTPAYVVPPIDNIADGPSGLTYYPGTGLGDEFKNCFMLVDFRGGPNNSGIRLVKVKPKGAFWEIERNEQLIWNILATDADFGPDGALWVCDWVDGWVGEGKGRIYRFFNPATREQPIVAEVTQVLKEGFQKLPVDRLASLLNHVDRRLRLGAQWELAARGAIEPFMQLASAGSGLPRLHAAWGLAQTGRLHPSQRAVALDALLPLIEDQDAAVRAAALQSAADMNWGESGLVGEGANALKAAALKHVGDSEPRVQYQAALASYKLRLAEAVDPVCKLLADNADSDPAIRHAGIMALSGSPDTTRIVALAQHPSRSVRLAAAVALRKRLDPRVSEFLADSDVAVQTEAARAIHDVPQLHGALASLAALTLQKNTPEPLLHRALNAHFRLGAAENAAAIAAIAADGSRPESMRREALEMLRAWSAPGDLDRVMNRHLPLADRDAAPAKTALARALAGAMSGSEKLKSLALSVAAELGVAEAAAELDKAARLASLDADSRVSAVEGLLKLDIARATALVRDLAMDPEASVRAAALRGLVKLDPAAAVPLLERATGSEAVVERQAAWDTLAELDNPEATKIITAGLEKYVAGQLPADVWMNVIEASEGRVSAASRTALEAFEKSELEKDPLAAYRDCLSGGDAEAGEEIFMTRTELSCVRCHRVGRKGGEVGPVLTGIAKTKDSRYLLESIVNPDAKIAENFETAVILTDDDQVVTGIVKKETKEMVSLMTAEGKLIEVPVETITVRKKGKSSMPSDLLKHMTRRQLRDLVAYMSSLKGR